MKCLIGQLLEGLRYIHDNGVIHRQDSDPFRSRPILPLTKTFCRDVKTDNILVAADGTLKIIDFGCARRQPDSIRPMTPLVTTIWYAAPEMLLDARMHTTAVDMFGTGVVLAELLLREGLFQADEPRQLLTLMCRILGLPSNEDEGALLQLGCHNLVYGLSDFTVPVGGGLLAAKFNFCDVETVQMMRALLHWSPRERLTAAEGLGEGLGGEVARAWWAAQPHAVAKKYLSFLPVREAAAIPGEASRPEGEAGVASIEAEGEAAAASGEASRPEGEGGMASDEAEGEAAAVLGEASRPEGEAELASDEAEGL